MPTLLIAGDRAGCGKTSLAAALLVELSGAGRSAAYHKPAPPDADSRFVVSVLTALPGVTVLGGAAPASTGLLRPGIRAFRDTVVVELPPGHDPAAAAAELDARVLLVSGYPVSLALQATVAALGTRAAGVIVNAVPPYQTEAAVSTVGAIHESSQRNTQSIETTPPGGLPAVAVPEDRVMLAATVEQVASHLGAEWVLEPVNADALIERYLIGGNLMDSGPTYFGRYANQAVITRAQRPDIQLACMSSETRCLVLTGPGDATEYVKAEARERDIPLLRVPTSTQETADSLDGILGKVTSHSLRKARHYAGLLRKHDGAETLTTWLA